MDWGAPWEGFWKWDWALYQREKRVMKRLNIFHDEVWLILRQSLSVNQLGGSWGVLLREILNLRSSEIVRKDVFFYLFFASSKFSRKAPKFQGKGCFAQDFEKWGAFAPCAPGSYVYVWGQNRLPTLSWKNKACLPLHVRKSWIDNITCCCKGARDPLLRMVGMQSKISEFTQHDASAHDEPKESRN